MRIALTLQNNGSVARDHLASERTFLAYVRTSLALASMGVALVQLFSVKTKATDGLASSESVNALQSFARPISATTIILGLVVLVIGTARFFIIQEKLTMGVFPVSRMFTIGMAGSLAALIAVVFAILVANE